MDNNENSKTVTIPKETQKEILKFFLKTSIPRIAQQKRISNAPSEKEGQEKK